jgi:hypothetical protein
MRPQIEAVREKFAQYLPSGDRRPSTFALHDLYDQNAILRANGHPFLPGFSHEDYKLIDNIVTACWFKVSYHLMIANFGRADL